MSMNNQRNKNGRRVVERQRKNPKLAPATNRYTVNFSSEEEVTELTDEYQEKLAERGEIIFKCDCLLNILA